MAEIRIHGGGTNHVKVTPGKADVSFKPGDSDTVEVSEKPWYVVTYGPPNKALAEVLLDGRLAKIVEDYTAQVASNYRTMLESRSGNPPRLASTIQATVNPYWGFKRDRWVGEVSVGSEQSPYGAADEFGRNQYAPYRGSADLENALRMVLRDRP